MKAFILKGVLYIPVKIEGKGIIGPAMVPIDEKHPDYKYWIKGAKEFGKEKNG